MTSCTYSRVLDDFYRIRLSKEDARMVDIHFTGAAHHYHMAKTKDEGRLKDYHLDRLHQHLAALKSIVYKFGDFSRAQDRSLRGLEDRDNWHPSNSTYMHPDCFRALRPDPTLSAGQPHACDFYLKKHIFNVKGPHNSITTTH